MNTKLLFSMMTAASNGQDFTLTDSKGQNLILNAKQARKTANKGLSAYFAVPSAEGSLVGPGLPVEPDRGSPEIAGIDAVFRTVPLGPGYLSWEVANVDKPFTMDEIAPGGAIKYARLYGKTVTARALLYGIGLTLPFEVFYENRYYQFLESMDDARDAFYRKWAEVHYGLLEKGASTTVAYSTLAGSTLFKDVATINSARHKLLDALDGIVAAPESRELVLIAHRALDERLLRAQKTLITTNDTDASQMSDKIKIFYTSAVSANTGILCFPQRKLQNALVLNPEQNLWDNLDTKGKNMSVYSAFGAVVGDAKELVKVSFA